MRPNLRVIDGGLSFQPETKLSPAAQPRAQPYVGQIAHGITIRGKFIRFSPALRQKLASLAAEKRAGSHRGGFPADGGEHDGC